MSDVLAKICDITRMSVAAAKLAVPIETMERCAAAAQPPRGFIAALERRVAAGGHALIAEIKKASPSRGLIRAEFDPPALARAYEAGGATCLSVLTEEPHFQGKPSYLVAARAAAGLPVLRKDFLLEPYQILEARALGADCVLLIMAAIDDGTARGLETLAHRLGMDVLVEVHDADEMHRALRLKTRLIGINNRNLKTLKIDLAVTETLARLVPRDRLLVAESGLHATADLDRMARAGARCFLVGESLMKQDDVEAATRALLGENRTVP